MMEPRHQDDYLTPEQVCRRWGISMNTLRKLPIPRTRIGARQIRFKGEDVVRYEQQQRFCPST